MAKIFPIIIILLPPILTILSFSFSLVSTLSKDWVHYDVLSTATGDNLNLSAPVAQTVEYTLHRGLTVKCGQGTTDANQTLVPFESCTKFPIRPWGETSCEEDTGGNRHLCQLVHLSTSLMVIAIVFIGASMLLTFALVGLSISSVSLRGALLGSKTPGGVATTTWISLPTMTFLLIGVLSCFIGSLIGLHALVDEQRSQGDWIVTGSDPSDITPWVMGTAGAGYATASWMCALAAMMGCLLIWGLPRMGFVDAQGNPIGVGGTGTGNGDMSGVGDNKRNDGMRRFNGEEIVIVED